jgi:hypothetical protein
MCSVEGNNAIQVKGGNEMENKLQYFALSYLAL